MRNRTKRMISAALAAALAGSMMLAGCGSTPSGNDGNTGDAGNAGAAGGTETAGGAAASGKSDSGEYPTLTWYLPGDPTAMTSDGYEAVSAALNEYLEEKLGCHLEMKIYAFSEYNQKCSTVISAGEHYDLMFTCDWLNNFASNAGSNAYLPLNDLLEANAPEAMADLPEYMWKATTINDNIYAMPALQVYAKNDGYFLRADIAEELGIKGSSYENGVDTYTMDEIGDIYAQIVKAHPEVNPDDSCDLPWLHQDEAVGFNLLGGFDVPGAVRFSDEGTVFDQFASEEFMESCKRVYDWQQKGYYQPDFASYATQTDQQTLDWKSENHVTYQAGFTAPSVAGNAVSSCEWDETPVPLIVSDKYAVTSGVTQSLTAVGVNSDYPELAVQLYNLAYSDEWFINTMIYGIEGENYTKVSDTEVEINRESNYVMPVASFAIANQFNTWVEYGTADADQWEKAKEFCADATPSELFGFIFDSSAVQNEVANCSAIYEEYKFPLLCGAVDPEKTIPEMLNRMEQAGSAAIIEEMQRQVDEFLGK